MFDYKKAQETNEKIKSLLLERGIKVAENRTPEELEQDLLKCSQKLGIKLNSSGAKQLQKKYDLV
mgnify:CR=1 FL=1